MQYFILLSLPVLLCLSIIVIVILCFKKKWKVASVLMIVVLLFNWYFKIYAINFHSQSDSGNRFRILSYNIHSQGAYLDTSRYNPHILFEVIKRQTLMLFSSKNMILTDVLFWEIVFYVYIPISITLWELEVMDRMLFIVNILLSLCLILARMNL